MNEADPAPSWEDVLDEHLVQAGRAPGGKTPGKDAATVATLERTSLGETVAQDITKQRIYAAIREGRPLPCDIFDEGGRFLLGAGSCVTPEFVDVLRKAGIQHVRFRPRSAPAEETVDLSAPPSPDDLWTPRSRELDERLAGEMLAPVPIRSIPAWRRPRLSVDDLKREAARGTSVHTRVSSALADLSEDLKQGKRLSVDQVEGTIEQLLNMAMVDFDLLPLIVAMKRSGDDYLFDHCVNVSLLGVAMASQMGLDRDQVRAVGLGGLLHDIGMLRVPLSIRQAARPLTEREWHEVRRHPLHSLDMLASVRGLPQLVKMIVYQVHERSDGSGYPRGRRDAHLHQLSKIVGVADAYAAMTRERPYRPAMAPYEAARTILYEGAQGRFDRSIVRAMLDTVSLFPIGSRVVLSNGAAARVLRAVPGLHTRPVVEELGGDGSPTGHIIELAQNDHLRIVSAG